jgi:hypothetical protein
LIHEEGDHVFGRPKPLAECEQIAMMDWKFPSRDIAPDNLRLCLEVARMTSFV